MPYTLEQGQEVLKDTIKNKITHVDYDRVVKIADEYTKYVSGEDIGSLLKQFNPRESIEQFTQRKELTQAITSDMANRILTPMFKIGRSHADVTISWDNSEKADEKKNELVAVASDFYGDESVEHYLTNRMVELDGTDPNSFIVVEFDGEVNPIDKTTKVEPYPFEVNSKEAINYKYVNNELQFLIVFNGRHTLYLENEAITAEQILVEEISGYILESNQELFTVKDNNGKIIEAYILTTTQHKAGRIPARRVGTKKDLTTRGRTCVPIIHPAHPYFKKSIKTVSEFDLTNCLHVFQQKIQYDEVCPGDITKHSTCNTGKTADGGMCSVCKGTGWKTHTSSADIIRVKLPRDPKDIVSLENYIAYKGPKMDLLEFQKKLGLYELTELAVKAVYNSDLYNSNQTVATATEKTIDLDSVYDTLKPFADSWSAMWKHIMHVIASYRDLDKGITIQHKFPKDFKMKSVTMLLEDLNKANNSGAPSYIKNEINKDLAQKLYIDKPNELLKIDVKNKFFPFNGKTENEINNIITNDLTSKFNKILYANFDNIFDELDSENSVGEVNFYMIEKSKQLDLIKAKVQVIIDELDSSMANDRAIAFNPSNIEGGGNGLSQSVGGLTGMIEIAKAVASGLYDLDAAIALVSDRFGITEDEARKQLGTPSISGEQAINKVATLT
jgi:hypothetical protein